MVVAAVYISITTTIPITYTTHILIWMRKENQTMMDSIVTMNQVMENTEERAIPIDINKVLFKDHGQNGVILYIDTRQYWIVHVRKIKHFV